MDKPMSGIGFRLMTLVFRVRDFFRPRIDFLKEAGIHSGFCILDFGCGPGSYIQPLAQLVGASGVIYALDIHPLSIKEVQNKATRNEIKNIKTIEDIEAMLDDACDSFSCCILAKWLLEHRELVK